MTEPDANTQVSHEQDGRVLTGVGVSAESLETTMERHAPKESQGSGGTGADAGSGSDVAAAASAPAEPPVTRGRQRFSDLTKERDSAKAETVAERTKREGLEREITELRAQLQRPQTTQQAEHTQQQLQQAQQQQAAQTTQQLQQAESQQAAQAAAQPGGFQFPDYEEAIQKYPTLEYKDWEVARLNAFADWRDSGLDARIQRGIAAGIAAQQDTQTFQARVQQTHVKGRETYKDFDTVLQSGPGALIPLGRTEPLQGERESQAMARARYIFAHPASEHLQHAIMKDGDLARSLAQMSDIDFGIRLAQLTPVAQSEARARFQPTTPYTPVGSGSSTTAVPSGELARKGFNFDTSGYREKRAAERKSKTRY